MSTVIFALVGANLGLYFTLLSYFPLFSDMLPCVLAAQLLGPGACALGCLCYRKRPALRFVLALLLPLALLLARSPQQMLLLAPAILYPEMILLGARFSVSYWAYSNHARCTGFILALLLLFSQTLINRLLPVLFGTGTLILGIFALRQLRFGAETGPRQKLLELMSICSLPAGAWLASGLLARSKPLVRWLTERIFYPVGLLIQRLAELASRLAFRAVERQTGEVAMPTPAPTLMMPEQGREFQELPPADGVLGDEMLILPILAVAVFAVILIIFLYRCLRNSRSEEKLERLEEQVTEADEGAARIPGEREWRTNRRRIRRVYEKYLRLLESRAFIRQAQDSSQEILEKTRTISAEEAAETLRRLYIQARYQPGAVITGAQVREARRLLKKLQERPKP